MVRKIIIGIYIIMIICVIPKSCYAMDINPDSYKPTSKTTSTQADKIKKISNDIIGPLKFIGNIVSVVALISIGIKYILGSVEERAEYKKTLLPYLIGAVMVFAITNLLSILVDVIGGF